MKDNNRRIEITDKDRVYIFQVNILLRPDDLERVRRQLKQQIQEGCVLLPPYLELVKE